MFVRSPRRVALLGLLLSFAAAPSRAGSGGPDLGGYSWFDVNDGCPVVDDTFALGNGGFFGVDNFVGPLDLGFSFPFYDRVTTQVWVNKSGLIFFGPPADLPYDQNTSIPRVGGGGPDGFLAAYWDRMADWSFPSVQWQQFPAQDYFKIAFQGQETTLTFGLVVFEVYLHENGDIRVEYLDQPGPPNGATIGIENFGGNIGLEVFRDGIPQGGFTFGTPMPHSVCFQRRANLDCGPATTLACGRSTGTSPGAVATNASAYSCGGGTWTGRERVYALQVDELSDVSLTLSFLNGRTMAVFLLSGCDEFDCLTGGGTTATATNLAPGTYYVVVDARSGEEGSFTLDVGCTLLSSPLACGGTRADTTVGGLSRLDGYACVPLGTDLSGPERAYSVDVIPPANLIVTVNPAFHAFIFGPSAQVDPADCLAGGPGGAVLYDPAPGTYLVVIDSSAAGAGAFTVNVECAPEIQCTGPDIACNSHVAGTTVGSPSLVDFYRCTGVAHGAPESVHAFDNPLDQTVSFVLDDSLDPTLDLFLLSDCNEGACIAVADREFTEELAPGRYYLVVDGQAGGAAYSIDTVCGNALAPATAQFTGRAGQCFTEHKSAWLTPSLERADVLFAIDLTGSMTGARNQLQTNMQQIIDELQLFIADVNFGLVSYQDYQWLASYDVPCEYTAIFGGYGNAPDYPYDLHQPITGDRAAMQAAVAALPFAGGGGDSPESYTRVLFETYSDAGIAWRPGAKRLVVNFGDEMPHDCNVLECLGGFDAGDRGVDLGRDGLPDTLDDLPILDVIQGMVDNQITLIHLVNGGFSAGGFPYRDIWNCWAQRTGGVAEQINFDGTVPPGLHPGGLPGLIGERISQQGHFCTELTLIASPGFEDWLVEVTPTYPDVQLPAMREFDIRICIPAIVAPGEYDFEVQVSCSGQVMAVQRVHVTVLEDCGPVIFRLPSDSTICAGGAATLDASGIVLEGCAGTTTYTWSDGVTTWTGDSVDVSPGSSASYTVDVTCSTDAACAAEAAAMVEVHAPPDFTGATARDPAYCNLGIELTWPAATFLDPSRTGAYNVYRSEVSCADAVLRPRVETGWTGLRWVDGGTENGRTYFYVVEAEDARTSTPCDPVGAHGGAATRWCIDPAVSEIADPTLPDGVYATLRASHRKVGADVVGHEVTMHWAAARALIAQEHFHLLKARDLPTVTFAMTNVEADLSRSYVEVDASSKLQFFDLRVANGCEVQSLDEYPPGF